MIKTFKIPPALWVTGGSRDSFNPRQIRKGHFEIRRAHGVKSSVALAEGAIYPREIK